LIFHRIETLKYLRDKVFSKYSRVRSKGKIRIWHVNCGAGDFSYAIAVMLREAQPKIDRFAVVITATDESSENIETARLALFIPKDFDDVPEQLRDKYFDEFKTPEGAVFNAKAELTKLLRFETMQLAGDWPFKEPFDLIVYDGDSADIEPAAEEEIISRLREQLKPGGILITDESYQIPSYIGFEAISDSVYARPEDDLF